ncbi:tetratricopeptide repeat protein [Actinokineospora auranticolor]|uniref:Tetratricopeptide repeat protein n=1 Tax=Actinokineospora auranticolor TaxID=155976 RepID=A0A2S6GIK1_9PSEU|nr:tetratricopeptide repeat protein [Actinokineospora auranticolor]PPK65037.1 tetratricopeptide repeat protein [Actinokineospora auranticolor]
MTAADGAVQHVTATGGFAYGVIGADIHVLGDGAPLYLLRRWSPPTPPPDAWLREVPSRLLHARSAVVGFTSRADELDRLRAWRDADGDLAAHWLHGPGGAGKTRLADRLAAESDAAGWLVVTATHGPGAVAVAPGSQDLRVDGKAGVLLVVDYADQWPQTHLRWLLSNALFAQPGTRTRLLLIARTDTAWPAVRGALVALRSRTSSSALTTLPPADRTTMFTAARDAFAPYYDLIDPADVRQPPDLDGNPEFGLTLAVHMTALVAVDAHAASRTPPADLAGTTAYLLDREHLHWHLMHERRDGYRTTPEAMHRVVFTATLTGAQPLAAAERVVADRLDLPDDAVGDHAACYPPEDGAALEPLYPDRLAEDFLALTLPGHDADHPAAPWAAETARAVLARVPTSREPADWTPRAVTFLAAAAHRWPHVAETLLLPLLRRDPHLAVAAGSGALGVVATIPGIDQTTLTGIIERFPAAVDPDLAAGVAAVANVHIGRRLVEETDLATKAVLYGALGSRLLAADRFDEALAAFTECVALRRELHAADPDAHAGTLAAGVDNLGIAMASLGRRDEAVRLGEEAVAAHRALFAVDPERFAVALSRSLGNLASHYTAVGRVREAEAVSDEAIALPRDPDESPDESVALLRVHGTRLRDKGEWAAAVAVFEERVALLRELVEANRLVHTPDLAIALGDLGTALADADRHPAALESTVEAVALFRGVATEDNSTQRVHLAVTLTHLADRLATAQRPQEAVDAAEEAVAIFRVEAERNPTAHAVSLAEARAALAVAQARAGRRADAVRTAGEAVAGLRGPAATYPDRFEPRLAIALGNHATDLATAGRPAEALAVAAEVVALRRRLAARDPERETAGLAAALSDLGARLTENGRPTDAVTAAAEAVELSRALLDAGELAGTRRLDKALTAHGLALVDAGRPAEAVAALTESVRLCRSLVEADTADSAGSLATALVNLSLALAASGRSTEALATGVDAIAALRPLAAAVPEVFRPHLARALANHGELLAELDRVPEAVTVLRESLARYRDLAAVEEGFEFDVAHGSARLGAVLYRQGEHTEAATILKDAVVRHRALAAAEPAAFTLPLARTLRLSALATARAGGDRDAALREAEESLALLRSLSASPDDIADALELIELLPIIPAPPRPDPELARTREVLRRSHTASRWLGLRLLVPAALYTAVGVFTAVRGAVPVTIATALVVAVAVLSALMFALRSDYATVPFSVFAVCTDTKSAVLLLGIAAITWFDRIVTDPGLWITFAAALIVATLSAVWARISVESVIGRVG